MNFEAFAEKIEKNHWDIHGAQYYKNGVLLHSYGDTKETRYPIYSATKAITAIGVGLALEEARLTLDDAAARYLPEGCPKEYSRITVRDLLTMSVSGFPFRPASDHWLSEAYSYPVKTEKEGIYYSNMSAYLVGVLLTAAVGEDLYEYLNRKLFRPLGIIEPVYGRSPEGYFYGASHMKLSVDELSRIGLLLYNGGLYKGMRLVSEAFVKEAMNSQRTDGKRGYGYFLWTCDGGAYISGKWEQKCYILPEKGEMLTFMGNIQEKVDMQLF